MSDRPRGRAPPPKNRSRSRSRSNERGQYQGTPGRDERRNDNQRQEDRNYNRPRNDSRRSDVYENRPNRDNFRRQSDVYRPSDRYNEDRNRSNQYSSDRGGHGHSSNFERRDEQGNRDYESNRGFDRNRGYNNNRGGFSGGRPSFSGGNNFNRFEKKPPRTESIEIEVLANYFELLKKPDLALYQYHVDFEPSIESKRFKFMLMKQHDQLFSNSKAFDGSILYSVIKLNNQITEVESTSKDGQKFKIKIKLVNNLTTTSNEFIKLLNVIFKRCLKKSNFIEFGKQRAYFDHNNLIKIPRCNINLVPGYLASMSEYSSRIFLCTEVTHKLINSNTVFQEMNRIYSESSDNFKQRCSEKLIGCTVIASYNKRTYRIDDIDWNTSPSDEFEMKNGTKIKFLDYYQKQYDIKIRDLKQPLLVSLVKDMKKKNENQKAQQRTILLVPELCLLTGSVLVKQFENDFNLKKDLDNHTKLDPGARVSKLKSFIEKIIRQKEAKQDLDAWQMDFKTDLLQLKATALANIKIFFNSGYSIEDTESGWANSSKDAKHLSTIDLKKWYLIHFQRDETKARFFMEELINISRHMGFVIDRGQMRSVGNNGSNANLMSSAIREILGRNSEPQMIVCILPNKNKDIYNAVKYECCVKSGIPSQCLTIGLLNQEKKVKSVITKIAIQMNCKLGGEIWAVEIPPKVMIVGIDINKDTSGKGSVIGLAATINGRNDNKLNCTKYFSRVQFEEAGSMFCTGLQAFMRDAIKKFIDCNNDYPRRIFVYRDGISIGQLEVVKDIEISKIYSAIKEFAFPDEIKLTFFVVKKRCNSRFFLKNEHGGYDNPPGGTVVDSVITKNYKIQEDQKKNSTDRDFYLIPQSSQRGSVSPTHFEILEDKNGLELNKLQTLTYKLTHMYYNWPGQIRVPAPCHYASRLSRLVGESLHTTHNPKLDDKLFYL